MADDVTLASRNAPVNSNANDTSALITEVIDAEVELGSVVPETSAGMAINESTRNEAMPSSPSLTQKELSSSKPAATATNAKSTSTSLAGMALVLASTLAFSTMSLSVNVLGHRGIPSLQSAVVRYWLSTFFCIISIVWARWGKLRDKATWIGAPEHIKLLIMRGVWGAGGMSSYFYSLSMLNISDAVALSFTNVPLTGVFAAIVLKEAYTWLDGITAILCSIGVVIIAQPEAIFGASDGGSGGEIPWFGVLTALFGAVCATWAFITIRQIGAGADPLVIVLYFSVVGSVVSPLLLLTFQTPVALNDPTDYLLMAWMGFSGFLGQALLNRGIQLAPAGPASVMRYADIIFSLTFQVAIFGVKPSGLKLLGCALIMSCTVGVLAQARRKAKEKERAAAAAAAAESSSGKDVETASSASTAKIDGDGAAAYNSSGSDGEGALGSRGWKAPVHDNTAPIHIEIGDEDEDDSSDEDEARHHGEAGAGAHEATPIVRKPSARLVPKSRAQSSASAASFSLPSPAIRAAMATPKLAAIPALDVSEPHVG